MVSGENANCKKAPIEWTEECQIAFDRLKELCTSTPILAYANYKKPFQLQTDASDLGLGAVLYQRDDNDHQRVIAFASRSLSNTERNYPTHKLEFLALKWVITDRFHEYLTSTLITILSLTYLHQPNWMPLVKDGLPPWQIMILGYSTNLAKPM